MAKFLSIIRIVTTSNEMMVVANGYSDVCCVWPVSCVFVSSGFALQTFALSSASISNTLESRAEVLHQQVAKNEHNCLSSDFFLLSTFHQDSMITAKAITVLQT